MLLKANGNNLYFLSFYTANIPNAVMQAHNICSWPALRCKGAFITHNSSYTMWRHLKWPHFICEVTPLAMATTDKTAQAWPTSLWLVTAMANWDHFTAHKCH